ncbi:nuclear transport factor 2 family protein [Amycolatopsis sp. A133]|uniref:nuclear transport factor 2 family protein n=1 Tax=Amycolatopsis sp. A133 TaxID=3064472 RepID=UPI0027FFA392|nr:nuclear transport factor 2 family protein [Amycolatopsis sp. A133]MDQ7804666.1 nuclear transport factor 2 family protein [Amycolatopsis sp. A133]
MSESAKNRIIVAGCLENLFVHQDFDAAKAALHPDFVTHSPGLPSGREAFTEAVKNSPLAGANAEIKQIVAEDDLVVVHLHVAGLAVVDILRVEDGLLVEHWDVKQPV